MTTNVAENIIENCRDASYDLDYVLVEEMTRICDSGMQARQLGEGSNAPSQQGHVAEAVTDTPHTRSGGATVSPHDRNAVPNMQRDGRTDDGACATLDAALGSSAVDVKVRDCDAVKTNNTHHDQI